MQNIFTTTRQTTILASLAPRASKTDYSFQHRYYRLNSDLKRHPLPFLALIFFSGHPFVTRQAEILPSPLPCPHKYRGLVHILRRGLRALFPHAQNPHGGPHPFLKSYRHFGTPLVMEIDWTDGHLRFPLSMCEFTNIQGISFHGGLCIDRLFKR